MDDATGDRARWLVINGSAAVAAVLGTAIIVSDRGGSPVGIVLMMTVASVLPAVLLAMAVRRRLGTGVAAAFLAGLVLAVSEMMRASDSSTAGLGVFSILWIGTLVGGVALGIRGVVTLNRRRDAPIADR